MTPEADFPYRIPISQMQADRRHNLAVNLLRLDLSEKDLRDLARVSIGGCTDALRLSDQDGALAFARFWSHYDGAADVAANTQPTELTMHW